MNDLNQCQFIGRLGKDVELRYTPQNDPVANLSLACGWKTKDKEGTEWVNVTAFGKLAEISGQYLTKGSQIFVQGKMKTEKYTKDGIDRYSTKIIADRIQMLGKKETSTTTRVMPTPEELTALPDDIPF
jgi:single-strand DNA-binding protein